jgi:phosphoribosyl-ATP pyrophosphohydrolase/phosphoribosyl-AMP cyclohydrolase
MLDFDKMQGLLPVVIQDAASSKVLMLGFMNKEAYDKTVTEKRVTFYSRSKKRLWTKGEISGNCLAVKEIIPDCDNDTLLILAEPSGPVCHTGKETCFTLNSKNPNSANVDAGFLLKLEEIIKSRKLSPQSSSYTSALFSEGLNRIAQKVGEEAVELVIASKDSDSLKIAEEAADLLFHYLVLLAEKDISVSDVIELLKMRNRK